MCLESWQALLQTLITVFSSQIPVLQASLKEDVRLLMERLYVEKLFVIQENNKGVQEVAPSPEEDVITVRPVC